MKERDSLSYRFFLAMAHWQLGHKDQARQQFDKSVELMEQVDKASWRFLQQKRDIDIIAWVMLENHVHWIAIGPQLSRRVAEFKSFAATSIIKSLESKGMKTLLQELAYFKLRHKVDQQHQLWQEGSHPQAIETEAVMWQKIEYIHNNPLRRDYVDDPIHWRYSSARICRCFSLGESLTGQETSCLLHHCALTRALATVGLCPLWLLRRVGIIVSVTMALALRSTLATASATKCARCDRQQAWPRN